MPVSGGSAYNPIHEMDEYGEGAIAAIYRRTSMEGFVMGSDPQCDLGDQDRRTSRTVLLALGVAITCVVAAIIAGQLFFRMAPERFVDRWAGLFRGCNGLASVESLSNREAKGALYIREFADGEWVAVSSECSCTGAGFDASVFYDSTGAIYSDTTHHFCGYEGLCGELNGIDASGLDDFYMALKALKPISLTRHIVNGELSRGPAR